MEARFAQSLKASLVTLFFQVILIFLRENELIFPMKMKSPLEKWGCQTSPYKEKITPLRTRQKHWNS